MKYSVYSVENIIKTGLEQIGARPKFWFIDSAGKSFMFKESRQGSGEDWAEKISCEICRELKIPHAEYDLASYQGRRGVITPNFVPPSGRLVLANELLGKVIQGYPSTNKFRQTQHTIDRALLLIRLADIKHPPKFDTTDGLKTGFDIFPGYLLLDTLVANQDRHHENWGVVIDAYDGIYLSPTFDHGSSLARNETDQSRLERLNTRDKNRTVEAFCQRASSAFYEDASAKKAMLTIDVLKIAKKRNPLATEVWIRILSKLDNSVLEEIVQKVPDSVMTDVQKEFTTKLILYNKSRILELQ